MNIGHLLADLEYIIENYDNSQKNIHRLQLTNVITNYLHQQTYNKTNYVQETFRKCKKFLKEHENIYILRSDKCNVTVAMSKKEYDEKAKKLLDDKKYYIRLNKDPTASLQQQANKLITQLERKGSLDKTIAKSLKTYNSITPRFYALPKIHKLGTPLRPIIASMEAPNESLAKHITQILTTANNQDNEHTVKNAFEVAKFINNLEIPQNYVIISLDVVSLFTNLSIKLVKKSLEKKWNLIQQHTNLNKTEFWKVIEFIFESNVFLFDNNVYLQKFGVPMGNCISPILSTYVLEDLIEISLGKLSFSVPFLKRYVDDILTAVPQDKIDETLKVFNAYDVNLQFTVETETANSVPFLDMRVIRTSINTLITEWYRKPSDSNRLMNYHSYHPLQVKINLIMALKNRAIKLSHITKTNITLRKLQTILLENAYPKKLVNKLLYSSRQDQTMVNRQETRTENNNKEQNHELVKFASLPYIEHLTPKLINIVRNSSTLIAKKNVLNVGRIFSHTKARYETLESRNVVYQIPCGGCEAVYIGQTSRNLKGRIITHKSDCRLKKNTCALVDHHLTTNHTLNFDEAKVLERENHQYKREFKEMLRIKQEHNIINKKSDMNNLSNIYSYLLQKGSKIE